MFRQFLTSAYSILVISALIALGACTTGQGYNGWVPSPQQRQAVQAPSRLIGSPANASKVTAEDRSINDGFSDPGTRLQETGDQRLQDIKPSGFEMTYGEDGQQDGRPYDSYSDYGSYPDTQAPVHDDSQRREEPIAAPVNIPAVKVGILLPLSGEKKELGEAMLNAAQIALFDIGAKNFELLPRDTKGIPAGARQAAESAAKDGAQLLLGPLFASSVEAVKPVANRYGLNMLAFSTDWMLADNHTFIMGFLPFAQVQRISEYAAQQGLVRIGILAPNDLYGNVVARTFQEYAARNGLEIVDIVKYNPLQKDMSPAIRTFTDYDRRVALLNRQKKLVQERLAADPSDEQAKLQLAELEQMTSFGDTPFDAVLMPMGGDQARTLANLLSFYDLGPEKVQRLGTGLWDDHSLAREPHLKGALFAAPSPTLRLNFERRYKQLYGQSPPRLASLAYDATALAAVLSRNNTDRNRYLFSRQTLINPNGFAGIDGIFRFRPDGLIERGLSVLEYRNNTIRELEPAPQTFETYGRS